MGMCACLLVSRFLSDCFVMGHYCLLLVEVGNRVLEFIVARCTYLPYVGKSSLLKKLSDLPKRVRKLSIRNIFSTCSK